MHRLQVCFGIVSLVALAVPPPAAVAQALRVELDSASLEWVPRDHAVQLHASRRPSSLEGRIAILLGATDVTDLFAWREGGLVYRPELLPLPSGEHELAVYLVAPTGEWDEIGRFPLRVLTPGGFEKAEFAPKLDLQGTSLVEEKHNPHDRSSANPDEGTLQLHLGGGVDRSGWRFSSHLNTVGVSARERALRFGSEGERAPQFDLADYSLRLERGDDGATFFELGHLSWGRYRHLIQDYSSRGLRVGLPLGRPMSVSLAAVNGTSIAGWDNPFGLSQGDHRMLGGGLGFELVPSRPGGLRLDLGYLDGSLLSLAGYNQGTVSDAEESQGLALGLAGETAARRLWFDAGYTRSRFDNPFDPGLAQGGELVTVEEEERDARHLELGLGLLRGKGFGDGRTADLELLFRHERVEPQYRSVAAFTQADLEQNAVELRGTLGPLQILGGHSRSEDNLDGVASILTTKTRRSSAGLTLALADFARRAEKGARWLPVLTYSFDRTRQFGAGVPVDSGFSPSHVPDQVSDRHGGGLVWQGSRWSFGYRLDHATQDNRQPGRERADFAHLVHGWSLSLTPHEALDLGFEVTRERAFGYEQDRLDRTLNYGLNLLWRVTSRLALAGAASLAETEDEPPTNESETMNLDANLTYRIDWQRGEEHGVASQLFLRYSDTDHSALDRLFGLDVERRDRALRGGLSVSLF